jgi:hypothetical protein
VRRMLLRIHSLYRLFASSRLKSFLSFEQKGSGFCDLCFFFFRSNCWTLFEYFLV